MNTMKIKTLTGRDTQEEIIEDQTYKPTVDEQEGDTLDKALAMQGKEHEEEQDKEEEDYNLRYYCFDDQEGARFYEILTPKDPQLGSISVVGTMVPSKSIDALSNKPIHELDQLPIKKELDEEEPMEINDVTIPADVIELDLEISNRQDVVIGYKETSIPPGEEINDPIEPKMNLRLFLPTKIDLRSAPFEFSHRTCPNGTKGPNVMISIKEPTTIHDPTITKNHVIVLNRQVVFKLQEMISPSNMNLTLKPQVITTCANAYTISKRQPQYLKVNKGPSQNNCELIRSLFLGWVVEKVPNWLCKGTTEYDNRISPYLYKGGFNNSKIYVEDLRCIGFNKKIGDLLLVRWVQLQPDLSLYSMHVLDPKLGNGTKDLHIIAMERFMSRDLQEGLKYSSYDIFEKFLDPSPKEKKRLLKVGAHIKLEGSFSRTWKLLVEGLYDLRVEEVTKNACPKGGFELTVDDRNHKEQRGNFEQSRHLNFKEEIRGPGPTLKEDGSNAICRTQVDIHQRTQVDVRQRQQTVTTSTLMHKSNSGMYANANALDSRNTIRKPWRFGISRLNISLTRFYKNHSITEGIALSARYPELLQVFDEVVHRVIGLSFNGLDVSKGSRISRELIAKRFCTSKFAFDASAIPLEELKNEKMHWMAKREAVQLVQIHKTPDVENVDQHRRGYEVVDEEIEENTRKKKGKMTVHEERKRPRPTYHATEHHATRTSEQPMAPKFLTWPKLIPDGHIHLDYKDHWKMFEDGLEH
eukprot:Gb_06609 [translate_table: standard]